MHRGLLTSVLVLASCGAAHPTATAPPHEAGSALLEEEATRESGPRTALELVALLQAIASGARPGAIEDHVDQEFARMLPSGTDLERLFGGEEEGCTPELAESAGYGAIAIPPPMEGDSEEEIRRTEAILEVLRASTEVFATCTVTRTTAGFEGESDQTFEEQVPLWAIAVRPGEDGVFVALAWRRFDEERHGGH